MDTAHSLGKDEAVRRLQQKFSAVRATFGKQISDLHEEWAGGVLSFGFKAVGMKVDGTVTVEDDAVELAANVPLAAMIFKGQIEKRIREELGDLLA